MHSSCRDSIRELLATYTPSDRADSGYADAMQSLVEGPGDPLSRHFFDPGHFTASAFVLSPDRRRLLLIHHHKLGRWLQPGGHIEGHDPDARAAAEREVAEETGLVRSDLVPLEEPARLLDVDIHTIPAHGKEPAHAHYDLRFGFVARNATTSIGDGVGEVRWVEFEEVDRLSPGASIRRALLALRGRAHD